MLDFEKWYERMWHFPRQYELDQISNDGYEDSDSDYYDDCQAIETGMILSIMDMKKNFYVFFS